MEERKLTDLLADVKSYQKLARTGVSIATNIFIAALVGFVILVFLVVLLKLPIRGISILGVFLLLIVGGYWLLEIFKGKNIAKSYNQYKGVTVCLDEEGWHQYRAQEEILTKTWQEVWAIIPKDNCYLVTFDPYEQVMALELEKLTDKEKQLLERANEQHMTGVFQPLDAGKIMQENTRGKCYDIVLTEELHEKRLKQQLSFANFDLKIWHMIMLLMCWPILIMFLIYKVVVINIGVKLQRKSYQDMQDRGYATPEYVLLLDEDYGVKVFERFHVTELPWQKINRIREDKGYFFFYKDKMRSFVLPKEKMLPEDIAWLHKHRRKLV